MIFSYAYIIAAITLSTVGTTLSAEPITGEAQNLIFEKDKLIYENNVTLTKGDTLLKADKVIIHLDKNGQPSKIVAEGNVKYREKDRKAVSERAEYDLQREVIVLQGKARVEDNKNLIEAEEIVYHKKTNTLKALGKGGKVRTIYVEEEKNEKVRYNEENSKGKKYTPQESEGDS